MARLLIFNPEHDYALAQGSPFYVPPLSVRKLSQERQFLPFVWGNDDDYVLCAAFDTVALNYGEENKKLEDILPSISSVNPWGWNPMLKHRLQTIGIPDSLLPSQEYLETLRRLSHRRISILCNSFLESPAVPKEFFNVEDAISFAKVNKRCYFKLPWSSGGRGVAATRELNIRQLTEWVRGAVRRQGSVLAEIEIERILDFATLWDINEAGTVSFSGFSLSKSDGRGKYQGNYYGDQKIIEERIQQASTLNLTDIVANQKSFIESHLSPHYRGKLGIDMIADIHGNIYPCVEINLRRTMGHVALDYSLSNNERRERLAPYIYKLLDPIQ